MKKFCAIFVCFAFLLSNFGLAEEGMWLFTAVPEAKIKSQYGFMPTQEWLDHVRLASVKFPGGSGSFVSSNGLVMTNHHIGAGCINAISSTAKDYMKIGFYAPTQSDEVKCPNMSIRVLQGIEDITDKVNAALKDVPAGNSAATLLTAFLKLSDDCERATKLQCQPVTMYSGAMYFMYEYKSYNDVRLVFAPEFDIVFFGGDPDNFEYPRYDFDVSFLRVYENNKPVHTEHYFSWSKDGAKNNELVFVSGHPGTTQRFATMAQLEFLRDFQYPLVVMNEARSIEGLVERSAVSEEVRRGLERQLFNQQNSYKANKGFYAGLLDKELMAAKAKDEAELRAAFMKDANLKAQYGDPWKDVANFYGAQREGNLYLTRYFFPFPGSAQGGRIGGAEAVTGRSSSGSAGPAGAFQGGMPDLALLLIRAVTEKDKPVTDRIAAFRNTAAVEQKLFAARQNINLESDIASLIVTLGDMHKFIPENPVVAKALRGRTPEQAAREIAAATKIIDIDFRKQVYDGGKSAIESTDDPLLALVYAAEEEGRRTREEWTAKVVPLEAARNEADSKIAKIRFAIRGLASPPDANSTLRLSYGAIKGYVDDGSGTVPKGTKLEPFTTIGQVYAYSLKHGSKEPYRLPESWIKAKEKVNAKTPLNFVSTADLAAGNSGSPVLNKKAEIVGLIFDGNIQMLPGRFQYESKLGRSISVDSRAIIEALRNIYNEAPLADELDGK
jgi:hypothetical protein